jgi:hypothetical protein
MGLAVDVATGDRNPIDDRLDTFNPLFPNAYYLAGYTGFPNLIHVRPALTVHPAGTTNLTAAFGGQWRQTTADAVWGLDSHSSLCLCIRRGALRDWHCNPTGGRP